MFEICCRCGKLISGINIKQYKKEMYCVMCFEVKSLIDGLILDFKIDKVENLILTNQVEDFNRGRTEIN